MTVASLTSSATSVSKNVTSKTTVNKSTITLTNTNSDIATIVNTTANTQLLGNASSFQPLLAAYPQQITLPSEISKQTDDEINDKIERKLANEIQITGEPSTFVLSNEEIMISKNSLLDSVNDYFKSKSENELIMHLKNLPSLNLSENEVIEIFDLRNELNQSLLWTAAKRGNNEIVKILLDIILSLKEATEENRDESEKEYKEAFQTIIKLLKIKSADGKILLDEATETNNQEIIKIILETAASVDTQALKDVIRSSSTVTIITIKENIESKIFNIDSLNNFDQIQKNINLQYESINQCIQQNVEENFHPKHIDEVFVQDETQSIHGYRHIFGLNRMVAINQESGFGYKRYEFDLWRDDERFTHCDLRLNDIYKNKNFYGGKYAQYAQNKVIEMIDNDGNKEKITVFKLIPTAVPLDGSIPQDFLRQLERLGYICGDAKPQNFVRVKNSAGNWDYLPIDAKVIGLVRGNSIRSRDARAGRKIWYKYPPEENSEIFF